MSHPTQLGALSDQLITLITGISEQDDPQNFNLCRTFTLRSFRNHKFGRTNQFDVKRSLDGLEEKFCIFNSEDLADALRDRLNELSRTSNEFIPEVLSLILHLSDQPLIKSNLKDLEFLKPPEPPPPLTWSDIIAGDPLTEDGIWDNVDFAADSSDEESIGGSQELSMAAGETQSPSASDENLGDFRTFLIATDNHGLDELRKAQFWVHQVPTKAEPTDVSLVTDGVEGLWLVTELQVVREVLFMLSGLPTSLFRISPSNGNITWDKKYASSHSSQALFHRVLDSFAMIGVKLNGLRTWTKSKQEVLLLQTFRAGVEERLRQYNGILSNIQERFMKPEQSIVVSLVEIHAEIRHRARPLLELSMIVSKLRNDSESSLRKFQHLELLFDSACLHQMIGDEQVFQFVARLFFECFQTYLKPIGIWMKEGDIQGHDNTFFIAVAETAADVNLGSIWHDQYILRQDGDGRIQAPKFLHAAASKIFTTGKSVVFLKQLGGYDGPITSGDEPKLDFQAVYQSNGLDSLAPFSELFDTAFDNWIKSKHQKSSQILRERLFSDCGLWRSLDALEYVYFLRDGALFGSISATLFEKIDRGKEAWNDQFLLTEMVQSVFGSLKCVDPKKLSVRSQPGKYGDIHSRRRSVKILGSISIAYSLPWPIANVVKRDSFPVYQRIFTFLLQVRRAMQIVERLRLLKDGSGSSISHDDDDGEAELYYALRHRLLWFSNTIYTYLTTLVLIPHTAKMRQQLSAAEDMDAIIRVHGNYVARLEDQCLLSPKLAPIYQAIISLLDLAILLSDAHAIYAGEKLFDTTNRSISIHVSQLPVASQLRHRRRKAKKSHDDTDSSSSSDEFSAEEADTSYISFQETAYGERLRKMREQFERLCGFASAGLRGVARAGGEPCWEMLAEELEWGTRGSSGTMAPA
ncbi:hypothetical protein FGG08_000067 [Glutinoglossum americanum]|uniref:Spindle pole body component n=1 Tax=Glutinoglossum americanum TaxID=1670608 RepID=A0A9P8IG35_9PEZI|nr:hypothetical protein FGG08_000067 [Glutinoglossum americanum]